MRHNRIVVAHVFAAIAALVAMPGLADRTISESEADNRANICNVIQAMYNAPHMHAAPATCSFTDDGLLIKPKTALPPDRMKHFVFLAFFSTGGLRNKGVRLPDKVYVGFGADCQSLTVNQAAIFYDDFRSHSESDMMRSVMLLPHIACPK
jgi:hypothetical protein